MATIIILWVLFTVIVAFYGDSRKLGFGWTILISVLLSPLIGFIVAAASEKKDKKSDSVNSHLSQIKTYMDAGEYEKAKEICLNLVNTYPGKTPNINFQLARIYGHENDNEGALFYLKKALSQGYSDLETIRNYDDLKGLRETDQYKLLLNSI